jgi:hypothetical protein
MRAREFTINIPINIRINGDGEPEIDMEHNNEPADSSELDPDPVMVPPLQKKLEIMKKMAGLPNQADNFTAAVADEDEPFEG